MFIYVCWRGTFFYRKCFCCECWYKLVTPFCYFTHLDRNSLFYTLPTKLVVGWEWGGGYTGLPSVVCPNAPLFWNLNLNFICTFPMPVSESLLILVIINKILYSMIYLHPNTDLGQGVILVDHWSTISAISIWICPCHLPLQSLIHGFSKFFVYERHLTAYDYHYFFYW